MNTVRFPQPQDTHRPSAPLDTPERQAQKKDIAAYLSNHIQPNHNTTVTLSDTSGKSVTLKCNTGNPAELLNLAIHYLKI